MPQDSKNQRLPDNFFNSQTRKALTFLEMALSNSAPKDNTKTPIGTIKQTIPIWEQNQNKGTITVWNGNTNYALPNPMQMQNNRANLKAVANTFDTMTDPFGNATEQVGLGRLGSLVPNNLAGALAKTALASVFAREVAKRGVGRYVTNVIEPFNYGNRLDFIKAIPIKDQVKAFIKDEPLKDLYDVKNTIYTGREFPYRMMFGLQPRKNLMSNQNNFRKLNNSSFDFNETNASTYYWDSPLSPTKKEVGDIAMEKNKLRNYLNKLINEGETMRDFKAEQLGKLAVESRRNIKKYEGINSYTAPTVNSLYGNYGYSPKNNLAFDLWDFGLHPGEKLNNVSNILRYAMDKITDPIMIVNRPR